MKTPRRFIKSVVDAAKTCETEMPWTRGRKRDDIIASRKAPKPVEGNVRRA